MKVATMSRASGWAGRSQLAGWALVGASVMFLATAGLLLWRREGAAVFGDTLAAALAWCF